MLYTAARERCDVPAVASAAEHQGECCKVDWTPVQLAMAHVVAAILFILNIVIFISLT